MSKEKPRDKPTISDTVRTTIQNSGLSLYRIAKDSGVAYAQLHRFASGERGISMDAMDRLCDYLGLHLVKRK